MRLGPGTLAIVGPTASGKTAMAVEFISRHPQFEAISVDSMTIYREFSIGTAKPTKEELKGVPYHLVDVSSVEEEFSLGQYLDCFSKALNTIMSTSNRPLLVGGTSLYLRAVLSGMAPPGNFSGLRYWLEERIDTDAAGAKWYGILAAVDPSAASKIRSSNARRLIRALEVSLGSGGRLSVSGEALSDFSRSEVRQLGICPNRDELVRRIDQRIEMQLDGGWVSEVQDILHSGVKLSRTAAQAIGYLELISYLRGTLSLEEASVMIKRRTKKLAKRQLAWLKKDPRIVWVTGSEEGLSVLDSWTNEDG